MAIHTLMEKGMWKGVLFAEIYSLLGFKSATASLEKLQENLCKSTMGVGSTSSLRRRPI
jgi:hypothetical protein